jgi:prepilin-type processing-associated H-X9-DG protein
MTCTVANVSDADATAYTFLLPFIEQDNTYRLYDFERPWFSKPNYQAVGIEVRIFFCPSNRDSGVIKLKPHEAVWGVPLPPLAAACDYAFCRGANGALINEWHKTPLVVRGPFGVRKPHEAKSGVRIGEITDGVSSTFAMGDATAGSNAYLIRDLAQPNEPATGLDGNTIVLEQSWSAAGVGDSGHPWYGSMLAVTAQYGFPNDPRDEPMNRRPATPTVASGDPRGDNSLGKDYVGGFRSLHPGGCNFLFCDGSARFIKQSIPSAIYRGLSTYAGNETISAADY